MREGLAYFGWLLGAIGLLIIISTFIIDHKITHLGRVMLRMGGAAMMIVAMILI